MAKSDRGHEARAQIIQLLLAGQEVPWQQLDAIRAELSLELFGGHG